jgi:CheY-like chemotaxis protein
MSTEEKPQVSEESQQTSLEEIQETPPEPSQETLLKESEEAPEEIKSESPGCDGSDSHKWANKMEVQRRLSDKPDLKIVEKRTVLFVDDDEAILHSLERGLLDESYNKLFAKSGRGALKVLKRKKVHVIVTDMCMPEMTGLELLRIVRKKYPNITGMVLTGYELDTELQNAVFQGEIFTLIPKPLWKLGGKFERLVRRTLDRSNLQKQTPIYEAIKKLVEKNITGLPVVNDDMTLAGVISEKDVMQLLFDNGKMSGKVEDFMTENPLSFEQEDNLIDIAECFMKNNFRRVPITSEGKLVGIISRRNIIKYILQLRRKNTAVV